MAVEKDAEDICIQKPSVSPVSFKYLKSEFNKQPVESTGNV